MGRINIGRYNISTSIQGTSELENLAIVLPGRLDTKDYAHIQALLQLFSNRKYLAISFDPPGTWQSSGTLADYSIRNYYNTVKFLADKYTHKKLVLAGHSFGGYMALFSALKIKSTTAVIDIMGASRYKRRLELLSKDLEWKNTGYSKERRELPNNSGFRMYKLPWSFQEERYKNDLRPILSHLKIPKLFIAGSEDTTVKPKYILESYEASAMPKSIKIIKSNHDFRRNTETIAVVNKKNRIFF